jgi:hypothetical protein
MDETSLSISVDLEPLSAGKSPTSEALGRTVERLIELFGTEGVAATWVAGEPQSSELVARVLAADGCHEAALSVPSAWLIRENGRSRFAAEFIARKQRADAAGISLSTLAIDDELPSEQLELLVRRGITAIRTEHPPAIRLARRDGSSGSGIAPIRYGLWRVACEMRYRGGGWLAERLAAERICSEIDRRIAASSGGHLVIDAPAIALRTNAKLNGLGTILRHVRRERPWSLRVGTIAETVARLTAPKSSRSAQSILRAA